MVRVARAFVAAGGLVIGFVVGVSWERSKTAARPLEEAGGPALAKFGKHAIGADQVRGGDSC